MTELERAWYYDWWQDSDPDLHVSGSNGLVVNKETGRVFGLG
jgi:hypothetical protein